MPTFYVVAECANGVGQISAEIKASSEAAAALLASRHDGFAGCRMPPVEISIDEVANTLDRVMGFDDEPGVYAVGQIEGQND